jgi:hypothetical protein
MLSPFFDEPWVARCVVTAERRGVLMVRVRVSERSVAIDKPYRLSFVASTGDIYTKASS